MKWFNKRKFPINSPVYVKTKSGYSTYEYVGVVQGYPSWSELLVKVEGSLYTFKRRECTKLPDNWGE